MFDFKSSRVVIYCLIIIVSGNVEANETNSLVFRLYVECPYPCHSLTCFRDGRTHAKWSPVATAFYRLLAIVTQVGIVSEEAAQEIVQKCPLNVFDIEDYVLVAARPMCERLYHPSGPTLTRRKARDL